MLMIYTAKVAEIRVIQEFIMLTKSRKYLIFTEPCNRGHNTGIIGTLDIPISSKVDIESQYDYLYLSLYL